MDRIRRCQGSNRTATALRKQQRERVSLRRRGGRDPARRGAERRHPAPRGRDRVVSGGVLAPQLVLRERPPSPVHRVLTEPRSADRGHVLEQGPLTELARGPLGTGAALGLTLFDEQQPIARLDLADFAAQASTQPSPTAGWGVPENAIEFSLSRDRSDAPAAIFITLVETSVGRGWDSVGHAPGLYRNRIDIRRGCAAAAGHCGP
ncbi:hypothetical protein BH11GEM2_BH11GEM2_33330 [soil metagenome]